MVESPGNPSSETRATETLFHGEAIRTLGEKDSHANGVYEFSVAPGLGASTTALRARVREREYEVFPPRDLAALAEAFPRDRNAPFRELNTPLFPNANRLLPANFDRASPLRPELGKNLEAVVEGARVRMPLNHQASRPDAIAHQLHGLLFDRKATSFRIEERAETRRAIAEFRDFFGEYWTGSAEVRIEQWIEAGAFHYAIEAKNIGKTPMPVGFGSHPYFRIPSGNPGASRIVIPSRRRANIDDLENVLPDGTFREIHAGDPYDFNPEASGRIEGKALDFYYVLDPAKPRVIELRDAAAGVAYRLVALTPNIIGAQVYYPGKGDVVALELVTHHPDPRRELWGTEPTGMQILAPGESARYAYRIEAVAYG